MDESERNNGIADRSREILDDERIARMNVPEIADMIRRLADEVEIRVMEPAL